MDTRNYCAIHCDDDVKIEVSSLETSVNEPIISLGTFTSIYMTWKSLDALVAACQAAMQFRDPLAEEKQKGEVVSESI